MLTSVKTIIARRIRCPLLHAMDALHSPCSGPQCMAWRWAGYATSLCTIAADPPEDIRTSDRLGYCGLAGAPDLRIVHVEK